MEDINIAHIGVYLFTLPLQFFFYWLFSDLMNDPFDLYWLKSMNPSYELKPYDHSFVVDSLDVDDPDSTMYESPGSRF